MMLVEETSVPLAALPVTKFKAHLRLGSGFAEDSVQDPVLESFLRAAMASVEARTGKILIKRDFSWSLTSWRDPVAQALPVAPVSAISALVLINRMDEEAVIDAGEYRLEQDQQRPRIRALSGCLPSIPQSGSVRIEFEAGMGDTWAELPADIAQAVLLLAAHYYEYRNDTALGGGCMPFGVTSLIERYRTVRLFAGTPQ